MDWIIEDRSSGVARIVPGFDRDEGSLVLGWMIRGWSNGDRGREVYARSARDTVDRLAWPCTPGIG